MSSCKSILPDPPSIRFFSLVSFLLADNCDIFTILRHQSASSQNKMHNWIIQFAVKSVKSRIRRPVGHSSSSINAAQCPIKNVEMSKLLPGKPTMDAFTSTFPTLGARILVKYMQSYKVFKNDVTKHILHPYSKEMAEPSHQALCKEIFQ